MQRRLVDVLHCPICAFAPLQLSTSDEGETVHTGRLLCSRCGGQYVAQISPA